MIQPVVVTDGCKEVRVAGPAAVASVPNPSYEHFERLCCDYDLTRRYEPGIDVLNDMLEIVEAVSELVEEVANKVADEVDAPQDDVVDEVVVEEVDGEVSVGPSRWVGGVSVDRICDTYREGRDVKPVTDPQKAVLKRVREVYAGTEVKHIPSLKNKDKRVVNEEVTLVNGLLHNVKPDNTTQVNRLLYAGAFVIAERLGMIKERKGGARKVPKKPRWMRRIEGGIKRWRKDLGLVDAFKRGNLKNTVEKTRLEKVYGLGEKGTLYVIEFLKGKIHAGSCKLKSHLKRNLQFHQNTLFKNDQKQLYKELNGDSQDNSVAPNKDEATAFWSGIWSNPVTHNRDADWLSDSRNRLRRVERQQDVVIGVADVKGGIRRMTNWKAPGPDGVQGFWFKKFTSVHVAIAEGLQDCLQSGDVPEWMTVGRTSLFMKDPVKGPVADNYRPIACLPMMWKLLTGIFSEKIYEHLDVNKLLPDQQKGCRKRSRGTKDQLLIDKMILRDAKQGKKNLSMAWIDYKKAYDMVPHSWLLEVVDLLGVAGNVASLLGSSMMKWKTQLVGGQEVLGTVDIKRGIFQGDSLSPLLFVMVLIPLSQRLEAMQGYKLKHETRSINHLLFMDDLKLYAKSDKQLKDLVGVVKSYSDDIKMEFGLPKCNVLTVKKGKRQPSDGLVLPSGDKMKDVDEEGYKYLGVLQKDSLMSAEMKTKVKSEYFRRLSLLLKSELNAGNVVQGINSWAIGIVRYTAGVLDWGKTELKAMDVKTRKTLTLHGAFHRNSDVDRLYLKRKDGGRGLISVVDCVRMEEENLMEYAATSAEWMLQKVVQHGIVKDGPVPAIPYKARVEAERKERLEAKPLHGRFFRGTKSDANGNAIAGSRSWEWVRSGYMTKSTEAYIFAAQEQALTTNSMRAKVYREVDGNGETVSALCRVCNAKTETVAHIAGGCAPLMQGPGTKRHDRVGTRVHWELCRKYGVACSARWYEHKPQVVSQNASGDIQIYWALKWTTTGNVAHNTPDVVVKDHKAKLWTIIDFAVPLDHNIVTKQQDKISAYADLANYFKRDRRNGNIRTQVIPIVVGALGMMPEGLPGYIKQLGIPDIAGGLQTTALLGTQRILKNVLSQ